MSKNKVTQSFLTSAFGIIILLGLVVAAILYIIYSADKAESTNEIWSHFKALSILVVGYIFGAKKGANK